LRSGARTIRFSCPRAPKRFRRDVPNAEVRFYDTGHFALETHGTEIAAAIGEFLARLHRAKAVAA
jgi:pimeloyl-ACP methyl ester carboxylesterase